MKKYISITLLSLFLFGCSSEKKDEYVEKPAEEYYNLALKDFKSGNYKKASKLFDEVERQHPYSLWATKAKLMSAYSYYQRNEYDDAIINLKRFIKLHPGNEDTPYAYYLIALCYYEQIADVARDQKMTEDALLAMEEVVRRYPNSDYAKDAKLKLDLINDHLAGKEMEVGRFYQKQLQFHAALNRFLNVIKDHQTTTHSPEALHRLVECYTALGLNEEAQKVAAVLGYNFPDSDWYKDSYSLVKGVDLRTDDNSGSWFGWIF